jgi:hypothetical protein
MQLASPSQVSLASAPVGVAAQSRRAPLQAGALQVALTISGLSLDAGKRTTAALGDASSMATVVTSLNAPDISGVAADPPTVAVRVSAAVRLPNVVVPDSVAAALDPRNAAALGAALASSGIQCAGVRSEAPPVLSVVAGQLSVTPPPPVVEFASPAAAPMASPLPPASPGQAPPAAVHAGGAASLLEPAVVASVVVVLLCVIAATVWLRRQRAQRLLDQRRDRAKLLHTSLGMDASEAERPKTSLSRSRDSRLLMLEEESRYRTPRSSEVRAPRESCPRTRRISDSLLIIAAEAEASDAAEAEARDAAATLEAKEDFTTQPVLSRARRISEMMRGEAAAMPASHRMMPQSATAAAGALPARKTSVLYFINTNRWHGGR